MSFRTENVKASGLDDLSGFRLDFLLKARQNLVIELAQLENLPVVGLEIAGGIIDLFRLITELFHLIFCQKLGVAAEGDIGTAAGHIGGNGDGTEFTGLGDDFGFFFVEFGIKHGMRNAVAVKQCGQFLTLFDGDRADKHRLSLFMALLDLLDDGFIFAAHGAVDHIVHIVADHGFIGGDLHDVKAVDLAEFLFFGESRTGHTGELFVQAEIVLEGNGGKRFGFAADSNALFGFDGLMQAVGIAAADHDTSRKRIND